MAAHHLSNPIALGLSLRGGLKPLDLSVLVILLEDDQLVDPLQCMARSPCFSLRQTSRGRSFFLDMIAALFASCTGSKIVLPPRHQSPLGVRARKRRALFE
jgi:hypothetical protein